MSGPWSGGKGDRRRPYDQKLWDEGYERIFGLTNERKDGIMLNQPRKEVRQFAKLMERILKENDYKGSWQDEPMHYLTSRLVEEVGELLRAISEGHEDKVVAKEAADVANFAMMIEDNYCEGD